MEKITLEKLTPFQKRRLERNAKLMADYARLTADPAQSRVEAMEFLRKKYGFETITSVYRLVKREKQSVNAASNG